ncbi:hypothetical protein EV673_3101 [Limnobacter thiooxidans]|uniref:Uncharacterized protein n=1 Tax=Limnobacter thiooxidans TaxID=131080 RepID=A0AA86M7Z3_9BURK|nr:hypothetical protein [Limnobacter sp.]MCZ8016989.1 hypothetical protein [Limnobacter sp.]RZS38710.1 hypothetical protein EV673_3101 [Limnobacter thiooxidans]BET24839.1 hypothetical protein RGQ30_03400 [Limnobacter thiooxidans]
MKPSEFGVLRLIGFSRIARPVLDCALLVMCLLGYVLIQDHTQKNQVNTPAEQRLGKILAQQASQGQSSLVMASIDQQFESEPEMWAGLQGWLAENAQQSGQCSFSVLPTNPPYRMQCTGAQQKGQKTFATQANLAVPVVLVTSVVSGTVKPVKTENSLPSRKQEASFRVQGWVDTHQGRKHFDPKSGRWTQ